MTAYFKKLCEDFNLENPDSPAAYIPSLYSMSLDKDSENVVSTLGNLDFGAKVPSFVLFPVNINRNHWELLVNKHSLMNSFILIFCL